MVKTVRQSSSAAAAVKARLQRVIALHFDPSAGTAFWLDRARTLGADPRREIRTPEDLSLLGETTAAQLCERPLLDYIPRSLHDDAGQFVIGQTGGTTGGPDRSPWTAYRLDEFDEAFVQPFHVAANHVGFPRGGQWLFAGPSGPHVIGKVVRSLASGMGAHDPFSVDFDPRWAKKLSPGSFAMHRYLDHVIEQCMAIIARQNITVIFTTPIVLRRLGEEMTDAQRGAIRGVHYGGMALPAADLSDFQSCVFPNAVHLSGYGNTLFGCCLELNLAPDRAPEYFPFGPRLLFDVESSEDGAPGDATGRIRFTRLDESMLIVNMPERDVGRLVTPPRDAPNGFALPGVHDPHSPVTAAPDQRQGLY